MRVMLNELTRINSHLVWLGTHALDIGAMRVFLYCFREREELLRIFEMFCGQRMMTSYFRVGGLALEPPRGWHEKVKAVHRRLPQPGGRVRRPADHQSASGSTAPRWAACSLGRLLDLGRYRPHAARRRRGTGTSARTLPTSSYENSISKCRLRTDNDVFARYLVRVEEMRQSTRIVKQALEGMPGGPVKADAPQSGSARPRKDEDPDGGPDLSL